MRNDLTLVCENCALRLPSSESACPHCRRALRLSKDAQARGALARMVGGIRPVRDVVTFVPALLSVGAGVWVAVDNVTLELSFTPVLQVLFGFDFVMIGAGIVWLAWAGIIRMGSTAWNAFRSEPLRVVAVPAVPAEEPPMPRWTLPNGRGGAAIEWRDLLPAAVLSVLGVGLSIAGFVRGAWVGIGEAIVMTLLCTLLVVLGSMLLAWIVWWLRIASHFIRRAFVRIGSGTSVLSSGRAHISGAAHAGERELIAPLSGRPCIAFRVAGRMGAVEIDDALAAPMFVESERGSVALRAQRWLVDVPVGDRITVLDAEALARVRRFIVSRGLRFDPDLALGEAILDDGDRIEAWGALAMATVPTYRDRTDVLELTDDEKPLVVRATGGRRDPLS